MSEHDDISGGRASDWQAAAEVLARQYAELAEHQPTEEGRIILVDATLNVLEQRLSKAGVKSRRAFSLAIGKLLRAFRSAELLCNEQAPKARAMCERAKGHFGLHRIRNALLLSEPIEWGTDESTSTGRRIV